VKVKNLPVFGVHCHVNIDTPARTHTLCSTMNKVSVMQHVLYRDCYVIVLCDDTRNKLTHSCTVSEAFCHIMIVCWMLCLSFLNSLTFLLIVCILEQQIAGVLYFPTFLFEFLCKGSEVVSRVKWKNVCIAHFYSVVIQMSKEIGLEARGTC
jgi:hypothetical protein